MIPSRADLRRRSYPGYGHRDVRIVTRPITQLSAPVIPPAFDGIVGQPRAGVVLSRAYLRRRSYPGDGNRGIRCSTGSPIS